MFCRLQIPPFLPRTHGSEALASVLPLARGPCGLREKPQHGSVRPSRVPPAQEITARTRFAGGLCLFTCEVCQEPSHMGGHGDSSYCGAGPWIFIAGTESF